jgi:hypothetical protein
LVALFAMLADADASLDAALAAIAEFAASLDAVMAALASDPEAAAVFSELEPLQAATETAAMAAPISSIVRSEPEVMSLVPFYFAPFSSAPRTYDDAWVGRKRKFTIP